MPKLSELLHTVLFGHVAQGDLQDSFAQDVIDALERVPEGERAARAEIVNTFVGARELLFHAPSYLRLTSCLRDMRFGIEAAPPSRLGERTISDLLDGRIQKNEFAEVLSREVTLRSCEIEQRLREQFLIPDQQRFVEELSGDAFPEIYPLVLTIAEILNMNSATRFQLQLAWLARQIPSTQFPLFWDQRGNELAHESLQRFSTLIAAVFLSRDGQVPKLSSEVPPEEMRSILRELLSSRFDAASVAATVEEALAFLPQGWDWAFAYADVCVELGRVHEHRVVDFLLPHLPSAIWRLLSVEERLSRTEVLASHRYGWLRRTLGLEYQARRAEMMRDPGYSGRSWHRACRSLLRGSAMIAPAMHAELVRYADEMVASVGRCYREHEQICQRAYEEAKGDGRITDSDKYRRELFAISRLQDDLGRDRTTIRGLRKQLTSTPSVPAVSQPSHQQAPLEGGVPHAPSSPPESIGEALKVASDVQYGIPPKVLSTVVVQTGTFDASLPLTLRGTIISGMIKPV